jgi:hypothetical protein
MLHSGASQPGTPGGGGAAMYGGQPVMWGGYCQPLPYSPTALQIAAASWALGSDPSTPVRGRRASGGGSGGGSMVAGGPFLAVMPGSPMMASPGHMMFAQVRAGFSAFAQKEATGEGCHAPTAGAPSLQQAPAPHPPRSTLAAATRAAAASRTPRRRAATAAVPATRGRGRTP